MNKLKGVKTVSNTFHLKGLKRKSFISLIICFSMVFSLFSVLIVEPAEAKTSRVAVIQEITGVVYVKKAGGSKSFRAYTNMSLNQGDHITTENKSSVVLKVSGEEDVMTIGQNSDLYISELKEDGGKKTKFSMWGGSMWTKASSLVNEKDEFEIETPTAIMGVRGTNLFVGVNPGTGESSFFIASGVGQVTKNKRDRNNNSNQSVTLYPSQQINLFNDSEDSEDENINDYVNITDIDSIVNQSDPSIIEAIVKNKQSIDKENEEYIEKLKNQEQDQQTNQEDLDRITQNLDNLVGNIVKRAIDSKKVDSKKIQDLIDQVNQQTDKKLNLNNVKPLELSEQQKQKLAQLKQLEEQRKQKQEQQKQKQEELKRQNETLLKKLEEQKKKQQEENKKKAEQAKKEAEERLKQKLSEEQKLKFEEQKKQKEQEKKKQEEQQKAPIITPPPTPAPVSSGGSSTPPSTVPSASTSTVTTEVYAHHSTETYGATIILDVRNEDNHAITNLTASDVEIQFGSNEANTISDIDPYKFINEFTNNGDGIYTFTLDAYEYYTSKASIRVKNQLIKSDMYIFFNEYDIPDSEESSVNISLDGKLYISMEVKKSEEYHIAGLSAEDFSFKLNGTVLNTSTDFTFGSRSNGYNISFTPDIILDGTIEVFARGVSIGSDALQYIVPELF